MTQKPWSASEVETLKSMRSSGETAQSISESLGRSRDSILDKARHLKLRETCKPLKPKEKDAPQEHCSFEGTDNTALASSLSRSIRTLDDLLAYAKVDLDVWEVERYTVNRWEVAMREPATTISDKDGNPIVSENDRGGKSTLWTRRSRVPLHEPLYQIKAWLKRRVIVERTRDLIKEMLKEFKKQSPIVPPIHYKNKDGCLLEVSIFDLHLGKLCWHLETGQNYDVKISQSAFTEALESLISHTNGAKIGRILFPVGNDFFNVDGKEQMTTAGTPQHEDVRWQKSFVIGRRLMVSAILRLRKIAPVDVLMIPGNHDTERVFYLGDTLQGWLSRVSGVTVDNGPTMRKYYQYGKCMIGFTHGKEEKHNNLPLIMATEQASMWASTKFREMHLGHWHHKKETHWQPSEEFNGIRVRIIPSLCPADAWHKMKGFEGLRAAEAFLWDKEHGCVGTFSHTP